MGHFLGKSSQRLLLYFTKAAGKADRSGTHLPDYNDGVFRTGDGKSCKAFQLPAQSAMAFRAD